MRATTAPPHGAAFVPEATVAGQRPVVAETIVDPARIRTTMRYLASQQPVVRLRGDGHAVVGRLTESGEILGSWRHSRPAAPPFELEIDGTHALYVARWTDSAPESEPPDQLLRFRSRRERRVAAPARLVASVPLGGEPRECRLTNVSLRGLAFELSPDVPPPEPGLRVEPIEIRWKGGTPLEVTGQIVSVARLRDGRTRCGVALDEAGGARWRGAVSGLLYPRTTVASAPPAALWELYERSGYFGLSDKTPADFAELRDSFAEAQRRLTQAPEIGAMICWTSPVRLEGAFLHLEVWEGSWLAYQLARRHDERPLEAADDAGLHDLYRHCYEYVNHGMGARWIVCYIQDAARFTKRVNLELAARHAGTGRAAVVPFRAIELGTHGGPVAPEVRAATAEERARIAEVVAARRPLPYAAATGLDRASLDLGGIAERWAAAGLTRRRQVLVAGEGDALAALVLEAADDGLHLFGLLDMARLIPLGARAETQFAALLDAARAFYRDLGKSHFVYFLEDEGTAHLDGLGGRDLGGASYVILSADLVPELLEHLEIVTHPGS